ncbi:hypothetical protein N9E50_02415 [Alphaproteobacteria bacterium]|nr:hypothetical protein [Alphaproteobacteria bacterium]
MILLIFFIEIFSFVIRIFFEVKTYSPFYNISTQENCEKMTFHPVYSYTHDHKNCQHNQYKIDGPFVFYGKLDNNKTTILTLGGSTSDSLINEFAFPNYLSELCNYNKNCNVINGATGGFNSSNELLRLIVDIIDSNYKIDIVISLNGINDNPGYNSNFLDYLKFPYLDKYQINMINNKIFYNMQDYRFFPNTISNIQSIIRRLKGEEISFVNDTFNFSTKSNINNEYLNLISEKNYKDNSERWIQNVNLMNVISKINNIKYYVFLQPTMGLYGAQNKPKSNSNDHEIYKLLSNDYKIMINDSYDKLRSKCSILEFCYDISNLAPPTGSNYMDPRHHNENGSKIIAREVYNIIKENF